MSGDNIFVDTNVLLNLAERKDLVEPYLLGKEIFISIITEIEILGYHKILENEIAFYNELFNEFHLLEISPPIKKVAISLKQKYKLKLPDAVIAASAIFLGNSLLTFDRDFEKIKEHDVILIEF
jgi:predicted nucleic acid-binding protein